jgi:hypothetical protein
MGNQGNKIYRVDGSGGKVEGTITLSGPRKLGSLEIQQFWIQGSILIGAEARLELVHKPRDAQFKSAKSLTNTRDAWPHTG